MFSLDTTNHESQRQLGDGSYGTVCEMIIDDTPIAVKIFKECTHFDSSFVNEVAIFTLLSQQAKFCYDEFLVGIDIERKAIAFQLADGHLIDYAKTQSQAKRIKMFPQIVDKALSLLAYIHSLDIIHCDIKGENILVWWKNENVRLILADFGLASSHPDKGENVYTKPFRSPETHYNRCQATKSSDLWAMGMTLIQYLTKSFWKWEKIPWYVINSTKCRAIIRTMMAKDPSERLSVYKIPEKPQCPRVWKSTEKLSLIQFLWSVAKKFHNRPIFIFALDILCRCGKYTKSYALAALSLAYDWCRNDDCGCAEDIIVTKIPLDEYKIKIFQALDGLLYLPGLDELNKEFCDLQSVDLFLKTRFVFSSDDLLENIKNWDYNEEWVKTKDGVQSIDADDDFNTARNTKVVPKGRPAIFAPNLGPSKPEHLKSRPKDETLIKPTTFVYKGTETKRDITKWNFIKPVIEMPKVVQPNDQFSGVLNEEYLNPLLWECKAIRLAIERKKWDIVRHLLCSYMVPTYIGDVWIKKIAYMLGHRKTIKMFAGCNTTLISKQNFAIQQILF